MVPSRGLVTIVIDNFNYAQFVDRAIESALAQTYPTVEVVVVDDGSTDESAEVIHRYDDRAITVFKPNGGQASALNAGLSCAHGDVVLFLDSDDELYPDAVESVMQEFGEGIAKVHFLLDMVDATGRPLGHTNPSGSGPLPRGSVIGSLLATGRYRTPVMSGNAYSRAALERVTPIPEAPFRYSADGYLVSTTPFYGAVGAVDRALGCYRVHGHNYWVADAVDADAMRRRIEHDFARNAAMRTHAARHGATVDMCPELRDRAHLCARLASVRLDPARHPVSDDRALKLLALGLRATTRERTSTLPRRLRLGLWFVLVGLAPRRVATALVTQMFAPQRRGLVKARTDHTGWISRHAFVRSTT